MHLHAKRPRLVRLHAEECASVAMYFKSVPRSLGQSVLCVLQEAERVMDTFNEHLHLPVTKVDDAGERHCCPSCCRAVFSRCRLSVQQ